MVNYTFAAYTNMVVYGEARCNARAVLSCMQRVLHHHTPLLRCTSGLGNWYIHHQKGHCDAPWRRHNKLEEAVLHAAEEDATSTRNIAGRLDVDHQTVWHVLHGQQLHSIHPQKILALLCGRARLPMTDLFR